MVEAILRNGKDLIECVVPEGGFYLWCKIHCPVSSRILMQEAAKIGVGLVTGEAFYPEQLGYDEIRLCFAVHQKRVLAEAIKRLSKLLKRLQETEKSNPFSYDLGRPIV